MISQCVRKRFARMQDIAIEYRQKQVKRSFTKYHSIAKLRASVSERQIMIAIINVDKNVRQSGPHEYELRINRYVVARFTHNREEPLHECLLKAAIVAQEKATPRNGRIKSFLDPLYDDVYYKGIEWLNNL